MKNPTISAATYFNIFLLIFGVLLFSACRTKKPTAQKTAENPMAVAAQKTDAVRMENVVNPLLASIQSLRCTYFISKTKIKYHDADNSFSANASIRLAHDSLLWISVQKIGIEILRCRFTPDSACVADHYNKIYYKYSYPALSQLVGVEVSFGLLQALVLGNMPVPPSNADSLVNDTTVFQPLTDGVYWQNHFYQQRPTFLALHDTLRQSNLTIALSDNTETPMNVLFSQRKHIKINYITESGRQDETEISIHHTKTEWPEVAPAFPFAPQPHYKQNVQF